MLSLAAGAGFVARQLTRVSAFAWSARSPAVRAHSCPRLPRTMAACDSGWTSASCSKCAATGHVPTSDGFAPCPACNGAGKFETRGGCCSRHDDVPRDLDARETNYDSLGAFMADLHLADHEGNAIKAAEAFAGKVVGLYFTAKHCPACARFTPTLTALAERHRDAFVPVVVSGDKHESFADAFIAQNPGFLRVPFDSPHRAALLQLFRIYAIPALHVFHPGRGAVLTEWGHTAATYNFDGCVDEWARGEQGYSWQGIVGAMNPLPQCVGVKPRSGGGMGRG